MDLSELVSMSAATVTTPPATVSFSKPCLIGDFSEVPVDLINRTVTKSDRASIMTTQAALDWCTTLWGQDRNVASAEMIRWVSAAIAPRFVMTDFSSVLADWKAATTSLDFAITDGSTTEQFAAGTVASAVDMDDVADSLQTEIRTSTSFAADLSAAVVGFDATGRMYVETAETGDSATTYSIIAPTTPAGTDITGENYLNIGSRAFVVAGMDAEDPDDAMARAIAAKVSFYVVHETGSSVEQQQSLALAARTYGLFPMFDLNAAGVKDSSSTTDLAYLLEAAAVDAYCAYSEHSGPYRLACAAINGQILPKDPGSAGVSNKKLNGIYESGLGADGSEIIPLSATDRASLDAKKCDYVVDPTGALKHMRRGLLTSGLEVKICVGLDWWAYTCQVEVAGYLYNNEVTFSDPDITSIVAIMQKNLDTLVDRKSLEAGYTITIPNAADISAAVKATHTLTMNDIASAVVQYAVNDVVSSIMVQA